MILCRPARKKKETKVLLVSEYDLLQQNVNYDIFPLDLNFGKNKGWVKSEANPNI